MSADKYLTSVKYIFVFLLLLIASALGILINGALDTVNINRGMAVLSANSVYDALPGFTFDRYATNRDVLAIYAGDVIASMAAIGDEQIQLNVKFPNGGYDHTLTQVFYLGEMRSLLSTVGYCSAIAIHAATNAPVTLATLTFPHENRKRSLNRDDISLLNFSRGCNSAVTSMLMIKDSGSAGGWLLAISEDIRATEGIMLFFSAHATCVGHIKIRKQWFTENMDPVYKDYMRSAHRYEIVDRQLARDLVIYYSRMISGTARHLNEIEKASEDIVNNKITRDPSATIGPLTMNLGLYLMAIPLIVTVTVYIARRRMAVLESIAQHVEGPWILKDNSNAFDWLVSVMWCLWPLLAIMISYAIYSNAFDTGFKVGSWWLDWGLLGLDRLAVLHNPPIVEEKWLKFMDWYSKFLLVGFLYGIFLGWQIFRTGRQIMRVYTILGSERID